MPKTKLGISVGLMGALLYFAGFFGGYVITVIAAGYVLLAESNIWLRKTSVKAVALMIGFSVLSAFLGFIPDTVELIGNICHIFEGQFLPVTLTNIVNVLRNIIELSEKILFLVLGFKAFHQGSIQIPVIDNLINKHMQERLN